MTRAVTGQADVEALCRAGRALSLSLGSSLDRTEELVLIISELGTNLVRHAQHGEMRLGHEQTADGTHIIVSATDRGPGMSSIAEALRDGFSTSGGLGRGLGLVQRLSDRFEVTSSPDGSQFVAVQAELGHRPVRFAAAARPYPGEAVSGDAWSIQWQGASCRIAVIDGAGHGPAAAAASQVARAVLEGHPGSSPVDVLSRCHTALRGTRGAVITVALIDAARGSLTVAGVGNIESYLATGRKERHLVTQRGMLGSTMPNVRPVEIALDDDWLLALHSDGIRARFSLQEPAIGAARSLGLQELANAILEGFASPTDDALVLVAAAAPRVR